MPLGKLIMRQQMYEDAMELGGLGYHFPIRGEEEEQELEMGEGDDEVAAALPGERIRTYPTRGPVKRPDKANAI